MHLALCFQFIGSKVGESGRRAQPLALRRPELGEHDGHDNEMGSRRRVATYRRLGFPDFAMQTSSCNYYTP
jgi:hypothetical protein